VVEHLGGITSTLRVRPLLRWPYNGRTHEAAPMTTAAFALVLASAFCHSTWNFLLKRSEHKTAYLWSMGAFGFAVMLWPAAIVAIVGGFSWLALGFGVVTSLLHAVYGFTLSRSYTLGDLSTVYPVSRGMGPALVPLFAVPILGESVSGIAVAGIVLVVFGIYVIHIDSRFFPDITHPIRSMTGVDSRLALVTGALIATYTIWDKAALGEMSPLTLIGFAMAGHGVVLTPFALTRWREGVRGEWRDRRRSIIIGGILGPTAYLLVLIALTTSRVSYVAASREVGIVIGTALGVLLLGEGYGISRVAGSLLIVTGVLTLAVAP
jgi:drug/metabolite transporter (DMT)-like permease